MICNKLYKLFFLLSFFLLFFIIPSNKALAQTRIGVLFEDEGSPITTALDLRVSLWDSFRVRSEDIDGSGNINESAEHYGGYQTTWTITPDGNGYFVPSTYGYYNINTAGLTSFPDPIEAHNAFLQLEYKDQGAPNTDYQIYDFMDDPTENIITRYKLTDVVAYRSSDAGYKTTADKIILDSDDDATGGVKLQFGKTLAEFLKWDISSTEFQLSGDLEIDGILKLKGDVIRLDVDNTGAGENLKIVAKQGTDNDGILRYNATSNTWQINNDDAGYNDIHMANVFYAYDDTGGQAIDGTEVTLNLDNTIVSDSNYTLSSDEITINETGLYRVTVDLTVQTTDTLGGARANAEVTVQEDPLGVGSFADIPGALMYCYEREETNDSCSMTFVHSFDSTDIMRVRMVRVNGDTNFETTADASRLTIERIR